MDVTNNFNDRTKGILFEQYTGQKDQNEVEVYEGDICELDYGERFLVVFNNGSFTGKIGGNFLYNNVLPSEYIVIGNIHENPDLLKS